MPIRIGYLTAAHLHIWGYDDAFRRNPEFEVGGVWDDDVDRRNAFATRTRTAEFDSIEGLLESVDAVAIMSESVRHADLSVLAADAGKHVLCEKPLVTHLGDGDRLLRASVDAGICLMTAFPCAYAPAFERLKQRVDAGDIGTLVAVCATNRGRCPFGWFVDVDLSGGGAIIDHTVHVADLLWRLLGEEPQTVYAQAGSNMHSQEWEDTAMLSLGYKSGVFATLDASWSRPANYKTWGDVNLNVVGEKGVIEASLFSQQLDLYQPSGHSVAGYGSNLDDALVEDFARAILDGREPRATGLDGLRASKVALAAYESLKTSSPVALAS